MQKFDHTNCNPSTKFINKKITAVLKHQRKKYNDTLIRIDKILIKFSLKFDKILVHGLANNIIHIF